MKANPAISRDQGRANRRAALLLCIAMLLASLFGACAADESRDAATTHTAEESPGSFAIHFFDAGDADAALITLSDGTHILIDTGLDKNADDLVARLRALGVTRIDLLAISHPDKDHIGGADVVLEQFDVETVLLSAHKKGSKQEAQFEEALAQSNAEPIVGQPGITFTWGQTTLHVIGPVSNDYEQDNDHSLVLKLETESATALFPGDAENPAIADMLAAQLDLKADILKVPHHGKKEKLSAAFFQAVSPSIAVVPSDGVPDPEVSTALAALPCDIALLSEGDVIVTASASSIDFAQ